MLSFIKELLIIAALTTIGAVYSLVSSQAPPPWAEPKLAAGEILLIDAQVINPIWIDARDEADYVADHLAGAIWLTDANWDSGIMELMGTWLESPRPIVIYCSSESCGTSKRIAERLRSELPDSEVYSLHGGWQP
jgi:rhodanese-related sulfurtransferase